MDVVPFPLEVGKSVKDLSPVGDYHFVVVIR